MQVADGIDRGGWLVLGWVMIRSRFLLCCIGGGLVDAAHDFFLLGKEDREWRGWFSWFNKRRQNLAEGKLSYLLAINSLGLRGLCA